MFEESLLESAHLLRTQSRWPAVASFAVQATIAAMIVTIPMLHPDILPLRAAPYTLLPPTPIPPKPPVVQRVHVEASTSTAPTAPTPQATPQGPRLTPILDPTSFSNEEPPQGATISMIGSNTNNPLVAMIPSAPAEPHIAVAAKPGRLNISTGVSAGLLLAPIQPTYPTIAKAAHQEGTVIIHAIISKTGAIESANVVSGPAMLQGAALDAVRSAHYRPYRLNGEPTEVDTTFSINFRLSN